ncbi:MAG: TonB-dependent receptor, partial [Acidobacteriota bacterium]|nr:TonB-dependent receptor [Acidobacteriota bacterium]
MMLKNILFTLCLIATLGCQLQAQSLYGTIAGYVTDPSDAPIAGARVTIHSKETGQSRETQTNESGRYTFPDVSTGTYDVTFIREGFTTTTSTGVVVTINNVSRVDLAMHVGAVSESVQVSAQAGALQTDTSEVRAEITSQTLENAPIPPGRNYQQMFRFLPGVSPPANAHSIPSNPTRALLFNVNGASNASNTTRIDGATSTNVQLPWVSSYVPTLESIETVDVVSNSFDAEQGLAGGSSISVHTKSGTNQLHGSAFETFTGNRLKAKPFFLPAGQGKAKLVYNEFGGTFGGAIRKDKLFYFVSYQGSNDRENLSRFVTVPTAAIKSGDLSGSPTPIYDPATGTAQGANRTAFPGNQIPASRISPIAAQIAALTPLPNLPGGLLQNNYYATGPFLFDRRIGDAKLNWNATSKLSTFVRLGVLDWNDYDQQVFGDSIGGPPKLNGGNPGHGVGRTYSITAAATYIITPSFIADAYYGWTKPFGSSEQARLNEKIGLDQLHIPGTNGATTLEGGWPNFAITNYTSVGTNENYMPYYKDDPQFQYATNFSWNKGSHNVRFGVDFYKQDMNERVEQFVAGTSFGGQGGFIFGGGPTSILGGPSSNQFNTYATFLLGLPTTMGRNQLSNESGFTVRANLFSTYIRDQWAVTPKLTLSYGTRWEYIPFIKRADRGLERYDPSTNTTLICGVGSTPGDCGVHVSKLMFAPRLGVAYRVNSSFVIRAGYGITNDPYLEMQALRANYPILIPLVIDAPNSFQPAGSLATGLPAVVIPSVSSGTVSLPGNVAVATVVPDFKRGYLQSWNFMMQKQFKFGFSGQAGYVATRQVHEFGFVDLNAGQIVGAGQAGEPLFQRFGRTASTTQVMSPLGTGQYNALQSTLSRRFSKGLQLNFAYTWSKSIGIADNSNSTPRVQAISYFGLNRTVNSFDRTQEFHITSVWELPFGKGKPLATSGVAAALLGGWQTSNLLSFMTGTPFSVGASGTSLNLPGSTQRADQIKASVQKLGGIGASSAWFDPLAFAPVTTARFGNAGFNSMRGPGIANWDFSLFRQFEFRERY